MNILLVSSSSGGHIYPCYSLGKYLKNKGHNIKYLGINGQLEEKLLPKNELILTNIPKSFKKFIVNPIKYLNTFLTCNKIIENFDIIIGFGGFISYFISLLPLIKNKLFYLHEGNYDIGDSNKFALKKAKYLFTSFSECSSNNKKIYYVGNPLLDDLKHYKNEKNFISFVFGSLGSITLLNIVSDFLINQNDQNQYLLVTSTRYYEQFKEKLNNKKNVKVISYIDRNYLYQNSKIIFIRGGASTLQEILFYKINAVCIPSPYVKHHHQERNASYLSKNNYIKVIKESEINSIIIEQIINNPNYFDDINKEVYKVIKYDACKSILKVFEHDFFKK